MPARSLGGHYSYAIVYNEKELMDLNLQWLGALAAFVEHESFTTAARARHISQPALFVQVKKLGQAVGRPLYRREGRRIVITAEGRRLAAFAREVTAASERVLEEVRGAKFRGPVVLAGGQGALAYLAADAVRRYPKQQWPLTVMPLGSDATLAAVREGRAHVGIVVADGAPSGLVTRELRRVGQCVVVAAAHPLAGRAARGWLAASDLRDERLIVAPVGSAHRTMLEALLARARVPWSVAMESPGWDLMLRFAALGVGAAVVNDLCDAPPRCVRAKLRGAPVVRYFAVRAPGFDAPAVNKLWELL